MTPEELKLYRERAELAVRAKLYKQSHGREFAPGFYGWQLRAMNAEVGKKQILIMSSNRSGKTMTAGYAMACHLTNDYPAWWTGFRFGMGLRGMALGVDNTQLKDVVQLELFGEVTQLESGEKVFSGGWIHPDEILACEWSPQTTNLLRKVTLKGKRGRSTLTLRAYTQSKTGQATLSFAGTSLDLIWVDECPPDDLVGQLVTRTMTGDGGKGGRILYTMTPELGVTKLISSFTDQPGPNQLLIGPIPWAECPHLTPEIQAEILAALPEHEHDMRSKGIPFFGSGLVYPVTESQIRIEPFDLHAKMWLRGIKAIDLGINHPTAIVWIAYDPEDDTVYVVKTYKKAGEAAAYHAQQVRSMWPHMACVFPHDVDVSEKGSGKTVRSFYYEAGLTNTLDFKNNDGTNFVEPGIMQLHERMKDGRFKVFSTCQEFWSEFRMYHRKQGKIHKENDDVMDAVRYGSIMAPNYAISLNQPRQKTKVVGTSAQSRRVF